jgi:transposase
MGQSGASCTARTRASKKTVLPAEHLRPKLARHRARWKAHQGKVDQSRLVFIDETWIKTNMAPLRGWGPRCKRLIAHVPYGHWKTMTFLAALRHDRIDAPWVLNGPINGEAFKTYVRNELLKILKPGDIVVLDNLGSHKGKAVRKMIREAGAHLMFLPPYSPDLNPIEQVFAKIKHLMRRAMERTVEAAQDRLVSVLDTITPNECANYFSGAGYAAT